METGARPLFLYKLTLLETINHRVRFWIVVFKGKNESWVKTSEITQNILFIIILIINQSLLQHCTSEIKATSEHKCIAIDDESIRSIKYFKLIIGRKGGLIIEP